MREGRRGSYRSTSVPGALRRERIAELLSRIRQLVAADAALLLAPSADGRELTPVAASGIEEREFASARVLLGQGLAGRVAAARVPMLGNDRLPGEPAPNDADAAGTRSSVAVPLTVDERLVGVLQLVARGRRPFSNEDVALVQILAERVVAAIERSQTVEALRSAEERLRLALEATELGIWDYSPVTAALTWDARCKAAFGLRPDAEVSYETFLARVHADDRERAHRAVQGALDPQRAGEYESEFRTTAGRWVAARGRAVFDEQGRAVRFIGTYLDITDHKRAEEERDRFMVELQQAVRARDEFLSIASHELRTPLTALDLQLEGLERLLRRQNGSEANGKLVHKVEMAIRQTDRLTTLVNDLLDVSRISMGRLRLEPEPVDLGAVVREVCERLSDEAERAQCPLVVRAPEPVVGCWDRPRIEQVFTNLLTNAVKYGPGKAVHVEVTAEGDRAHLVVRDEGIGIEQEDLERIFGRFERAVSSRHYGGLGLGLYISRQIVEAHGGIIEVTSRPGEGATFSVWLPLRLPTQAVGAAASKESA